MGSPSHHQGQDLPDPDTPQGRLVHSHWSSSYITALSLVQSFLCHTEPARSKKNTPSRGLWMLELVLYGIRVVVPASLGKLSTNESAAM